MNGRRPNILLAVIDGGRAEADAVNINPIAVHLGERVMSECDYMLLGASAAARAWLS